MPRPDVRCNGHCSMSHSHMPKSRQSRTKLAACKACASPRSPAAPWATSVGTRPRMGRTSGNLTSCIKGNAARIVPASPELVRPGAHVASRTWAVVDFVVQPREQLMAHGTTASDKKNADLAAQKNRKVLCAGGTRRADELAEPRVVSRNPPKISVNAAAVPPGARPRQHKRG